MVVESSMVGPRPPRGLAQRDMRAFLFVVPFVNALVVACGNDGDTSTTSSGQNAASVGSGGASSSVATTGSGGADGGGGLGGSAPCANLSDDFEDASSLDCWTQRFVEGLGEEDFNVDDVAPGR